MYHGVSCIVVLYTQTFRYGIPHGSEHCLTILYHAKENTVANASNFLFIFSLIYFCHTNKNRIIMQLLINKTTQYTR